MPLENYIDHTLLKPSATTENIIQLCDEAKKYNFKKLSDSDLEYFRGVMKSVQAKVSGINENLILENQ